MQNVQSLLMRHTFPKSRRMRLPAEFSAVYEARVRESRGPLTVYARPNDLPHPRLYTVKTTPEFSALKARLTEEIRVEALKVARAA